jgi:hypothetical protein
MKSSELNEQLVALQAERDELDLKIYKIKRQLQNLCDHDWRWHQIVGEGRYCNKCMKRDYSVD